MSLPIDFVPKKPFEEFKWKWACLQCTEGLNDPVVLLGVLFRMRKLELQGGAAKYNSQAFADELVALSNDIKDRGIGVDLARRTGERNLIRNSGQYWRALGLIPKESHGGVIELTDFGRKVADRKISQTEFAALTVQTLTLPNAAIQSEEECRLWHEHDDEIVEIIRMADGEGFDSLVEKLKSSDVTSEIERKRVQVTNRRPNQARFRRAVLGEHPRCIITNVTMPEVLEAAHIVPLKYHGEDTIANGFCMRMDIHQLFDSGHLRIDVKGEVSLTDWARMDYGALIPPLIRIPDSINLDFVRWRWENYNGV